MKKFFQQPYRWGILFTIFLVGSSAFVLLKAFVIPEVSVVAVSTAETETEKVSSETSSSSEVAEVTDTSYHSEGLNIEITQKRVADTTVYIAEITVSDSSHLKTALAQNAYGRNLKEKTSEMAAANNAILAINGDYYGFRNSGYMLRNGTLYRETANGDTEALVIDNQGNFSIINESEVSATSLEGDVAQILSFGPALIEDGEIVIDTQTEVSQSKTSNPRTAIGQISENHYVIVVSDGRTEDSVGLSLYELAEVFQDLGAETAYNLDGGGSSTLYFNGQVINQTVGGSGGSSERAVSDILYFN